MQLKLAALAVLLLAALLAVAPVSAQAPAGQAYTVQPGDTLGDIADESLGAIERYPEIVEATNAKAAEDDTFSLINDPNLIEVGQKLWIPGSPSTDTGAAEEPAPTLQAEDVTGIYKALLPGGSSPGIDSTLYLNADNTVRRVDDYLNDEAPIIEVGRWEIAGDQVVVTYTGQEDRPYDSLTIAAYNVDDGVLVKILEGDTPGAYVPHYLPFEALATGQLPVPYDAVQAQQVLTETGLPGIYKGFLPAATCCGQDITLILSPDGPARLETDFLNLEPTLVQTGTWESVADARLDVSLANSESPLILEQVDGVLKTTAEEEAYGQTGLTLYEFGTIALNANLPVVSGTVTYRERSALPPEALITVRLVDVSLADAPAEVISEQVITAGGRQPPFAFELPYNPRTFDPSRTYAVQARIEVNDELRFISTTQYPVLTRGATDSVEVVVERVSQAAAASEDNLCAAAAVASSEKTPPDRSSYLAYEANGPVSSDIVGTTLEVDDQAEDASIQWRDAVLSSMGFCNSDFAPEQVTIYNTGPEQASVVAYSNVKFDDSVAAQEVRLDLSQQAEGEWQVDWGGVRFLCLRGGNTTELQAELCP